MEEWIEAADVSEFERMDRKLVVVDEDRHIGLFKLADGYYAVDSWCSHEKASLLIGTVDGHEVMCPLHGARFDLRTGRHLSMPAVRPVKKYDVKLDGTKILIKVGAGMRGTP